MDCIGVASRPAATTDAVLAGYGEIDRRLEDVVRVKTLCGPLGPMRERQFAREIARVRADASSPSAATRTAAWRALELLALELCDD